MNTPSRRQLAEERRANARERQGLEPVPKATLVERDDAGNVVGVSPSGLALVTRLARAGAPQNKIASALGLFHKQFRVLLAAQRGESDVRFAWERGHADAEHAMVKLLVKHSRTSFVAAIYLSKARFAWVEEAKAGVNVTSNVVLTLPKPRSRSEYFAILGIEDPAAIAPPAPMKTVTALPPPDETPTESEPVKEPTDADESAT